MINFFNRYPLPIMVGSFLGLALCGLISWISWGVFSFGGGLAFCVAVVSGLLVGVGSGLVAWNYARCWCAFVVALLPDCWGAHAMVAGLVTRDKKVNSLGKRSEVPVPRPLFRFPKVKGSSIYIPVFTNAGGINRNNADMLAKNLADVMSMSYGRVIFPANKNYCIFILSSRDETVI